MVKRTPRKNIAVLVVAVVLVAAFAFATLQGWLKLPEKPAQGRVEISDPGHEDTPFIQTPEGERIVPEEKVPEVLFVNDSAVPSNVSIPLHYRVKFRNAENATRTLMVPDIGIEEPILPGEVAEPTFYKACACAFWLNESQASNGTVFVG